MLTCLGDVEISGDGAVSVGSTLSLGCGLEGADSSDSNINYTWSSTNGPLPPRASVGEGMLSSFLVSVV